MTSMGFASSQMLNKKVTGLEWLQMSLGERRDYVRLSMVVLDKQDVPLSHTLLEYFNAIEQKLLHDPDYYGTDITNILALIVYETEPETREALDRMRKKPKVQKIEMH
jgi:hypothetical protein